MAILRYITAIVPLILLTGCYEDFNPQIDTKPVLCLNSLITAGQPIEVQVTHTWMFNDHKSENNHDVTDARVTVYVNDRLVGADYLPEEGDAVRIMAESPTYGTATAEVVVPYATPIGDVRFTPTVTDIRGGDEGSAQYEMFAYVTFNLSIEMDINDRAGVDNYYQFEYNWYSTAISDGYDDIYTDYHDPIFSMGQFEYIAEPIFREHISVFETIMGNDDYTAFECFSDRQFAGKTYTLHLNFQNNVLNVKSEQYDDSLLDCGVILTLNTVSQSYYNQALYKWNVDVGITGDLSDLGLAESMWGYSNVSTGAGVVAARSTADYIIDLKDFFESIIKAN